MTERLPRGVDAMLRWLLPGDLADPIAGDLLEEFIDRQRRGSSTRAVVWVWWQAVRVAATW